MDSLFHQKKTRSIKDVQKHRNLAAGSPVAPPGGAHLIIIDRGHVDDRSRHGVHLRRRRVGGVGCCGCVCGWGIVGLGV